jgi:hypothetical protein
MAKFTIQRTGQAIPAELEGAHALLFKCFEGRTDEDAAAWKKLWARLIKSEPGQIVNIEASFPRNLKFHRKFFALLNLGFEAWQPATKFKGMEIAKDFDQFRSDVTILAGFYEQTFTLKAKSIAFGSMEEPEFEALYSAVVNVLLQRVLTTYEDRAQLDAVVDQILGMA